MKICGIYKITNAITGDFYIGSSKDVKHRWAAHKCKSKWNEQPNNPMYLDMQKYGVDKFVFELLAEVEQDSLKEKEQEFIEKLNPTYNSIRANGIDIERCKKYQKEYKKSDKCKEYNKKYEKSDKRKKYQKEYQKSDKYKEYQSEYNKEYRKTEKYKKYQKEYRNQLCSYNNEILTLGALSKRFERKGISNPTQEAKKYLLN